MKSKQNKIDQLILRLADEFSKIPNFELTQTDSGANRLFNFIILKFSDIQDYKSLYKRYYIPATSKSISDTKKELKNSVYRKLLNISDNQLKENYFDCIRLGYVGLFHKVENFVKDLLFESNIIFNDNQTGENSIESFFEKRYNFRFNNWYLDDCMYKINWINNCVKHYDGYPKKEPKYKYLTHLPENEKIKLTHLEFFKDIDYISDNYYQIKLSQVMAFAIYKMAIDDFDFNLRTPELSEKYEKIGKRYKYYDEILTLPNTAS